MCEDSGTLDGASRGSADENEPSRAELGSTNEYHAGAAWQSADRLICPACHHTLETGELQNTSVHCEKCGGSFRLEKLAQASTIDAIRVIGRFQLLDPVGQGSFGTVWRARIRSSIASSRSRSRTRMRSNPVWTPSVWNAKRASPPSFATRGSCVSMKC